MSIDVEDWFHILDVPSAPKIENWSRVPSHVEKNFHTLLELMDTHNVKSTCFVLGWIAAKFPDLVRAADEQGHEIASHTFSHKLAYEQNRSEFIDDARVSREVLEDITGKRVIGYRAAGFSVTKDTPWFHEALIEAGYSYSSSIFPGNRGHGGIRDSSLAPYKTEWNGQQLIEFPITIRNTFGLNVCFFGGGYLRISPYFLINRMANDVIREGGRPVVFYVHPREIDPKHPRLDMTLKRKFKTYINLKTVRTKLDRLFEDFEFTRFCDY